VFSVASTLPCGFGCSIDNVVNLKSLQVDDSEGFLFHQNHLYPV